VTTIMRMKRALLAISTHELRDHEDYDAIKDIARAALTPPRVNRKQLMNFPQGKEWRSVRTMPRDDAVMVYSSTGIICKAKVQSASTPSQRPGRPMSIACFRRGEHSGDIQAIAWKPLTEDER